MKLKEKYEKLKAEIPKACIVAVTKYVGPEKIIEAYNAGIRSFGENKLQDAEKKRAQLPIEINKNAIWHFLGHLQTNKAKRTVGNYEYIHSVDSLKVAKIINETAKSKGIKQKIFIQVNIAEEETKYGFSVKETKEQFKELLELKSLTISGLMTMAPYTAEKHIQREVFKGLRELKNELQNEYKINIPELSMGMSNDYKVAYEEGATIVRLGQAIFN